VRVVLVELSFGVDDGEGKMTEGDVIGIEDSVLEVELLLDIVNALNLRSFGRLEPRSNFATDARPLRGRGEVLMFRVVERASVRAFTACERGRGRQRGVCLARCKSLIGSRSREIVAVWNKVCREYSKQMRPLGRSRKRQEGSWK
jgi:hypothetical protein